MSLWFEKYLIIPNWERLFVAADGKLTSDRVFKNQNTENEEQWRCYN